MLLSSRVEVGPASTPTPVADEVTQAELDAALTVERAQQAAAFVAHKGGTVSLGHDFSQAADTAPGTIGAPGVGPGGDWTLTGPGAATARILDGLFVSPTAVTYAVKLLDAVPDGGGYRFVLDGGGATVGFVANQAVLNIATVDMLHVVFDANNTLLTVWIDGVENQLATTPVSVGTALTPGVEYEGVVAVDGETVVASVYDVATGLLMRTTVGSDSRIPANAGPLAFIEPSSGSSFTFAEFYSRKETRLPGVAVADGGFQGPVNTAAKPHHGWFRRLVAQLLTVSGTTQTVASFLSSHSSGALAQVESTANADAGWVAKAKGQTGIKLRQEFATGKGYLSVNGTDRVEMDNDTAGAWAFRGKVIPPTPSLARGTVPIHSGNGVPSNASGTNGSLYFRDDGGAMTTIYQKRAGAWVGIV